jgi:hypothetical protein
MRPVVPPKSNRRHPWKYDKKLYEERNRVERNFRNIKQFRQVPTETIAAANNTLAIAAGYCFSSSCASVSLPLVAYSWRLKFYREGREYRKELFQMEKSNNEDFDETFVRIGQRLCWRTCASSTWEVVFLCGTWFEGMKKVCQRHFIS